MFKKIAFLISLACAAPAATFDAVADFSIGANPNGVWSYGYSTTIGGAFTPLTLTNTTGIAGVSAWVFASGFQSDPAAPAIAKNTTGSSITSGGVVFPTSSLVLQPGTAGQYAILRFTVPTTATYSLGGFFEGTAANTSADIAFYLNALQLFTGSVPTPGSAFTAQTLLQAGDHLDLRIGNSGAGGGVSDSVWMSFTVAEVPEPSSLALISAGMLGLAVLRRRSTSRR